VNKHPNLKVENKPLYGEDYVKALCASKINLAFLRKANQDQQTSRTIEIPACGAFMLAERTTELTYLFQEGKEAEFFAFDNTQELIEKITYYLNHETERKEIARLARERCLNSRYSYEEILSPLLKQVISP
jgi:spore maturation protein CgeB